MRNIGKEAALEARNARIGEFLDSLGQGQGAAGLVEGVITGFQVRLPTEVDPSTLLVLRASTKEGKFVAFVGAFSVGDAVLAWRARCLGGLVRWREDVPWGER